MAGVHSAIDISVPPAEPFRALPTISPFTVILAVLPVYLLMAGGAALRKLGILRQEHDVGIMHVVFSVLLPCFILDKMLGVELLRDTRILATGAGLGFSLIILGMGIGYLAGKAIGLKPGHGIRTFSLSTGCQNFGFSAVPVVEILCAKFIPMAVELRQILLVQAAMPSALAPILLARLYGGRPAIAVQVVIATTLVSVITLPCIITFGIRFLKLIPITP